MNAPWEADFFPPEVWQLATNLGLFAAFIAAWASAVWVWRRGPGLLIKFGPDWFTKIGHRWQARRD